MRNVVIGPLAGRDLTTATLCTLIGNHAGMGIVDDEGTVILGDGIASLGTASDALVIGERVVIGDYVLGEPCNLRAIVERTLGVSRAL